MSSEKKLKAAALREMKPEERRQLLNQLRAELVRLETQRAGDSSRNLAGLNR